LRYHLAIDVAPRIKEDIYLMFSYKEYEIDKYGVWKMPILIVKSLEEEDAKTYSNPKIIADGLPTPESSMGQYYLIKEGEASNYKIKYSKK